MAKLKSLPSMAEMLAELTKSAKEGRKQIVLGTLSGDLRGIPEVVTDEAIVFRTAEGKLRNVLWAEVTYFYSCSPPIRIDWIIVLCFVLMVSCAIGAWLLG